MRALGLLLALLACGCSLAWDEVDYCDTGGCDECSSDAECVVGSSCCGQEFYCMHHDEQLSVCQLGCYEPRPPACRWQLL